VTAPREGWRTFALLILLIGTAGTATELMLLEHVEEVQQWVPLAFLVAGFLAGVWVAVAPNRPAVLTLRALAFLYLPVAVAGIYFHLQSNVEFELELRPSIAGMDLVMESLKGAMPALAPGAMAQLGLLGLLVCFRHPALSGNPTGGDAAS